MVNNHKGETVGRLAVINNHRYNEYNHKKAAFFYHFECINDARAAQALFEFAGSWAVKRGLQQITGPKGFTPLDGMGLLVKGFEYRPAFGLPYNLPYYPKLLAECGFTAENDIVSGYLNTRAINFPEKI